MADLVAPEEHPTEEELAGLLPAFSAEWTVLDLTDLDDSLIGAYLIG